MKPLFDISDITKLKREETYAFECEYCGKEFTALGMWIIFRLTSEKNKGKNHYRFCSVNCSNHNKIKAIYVNCNECNISFVKTLNQIKKSKSGNNFCSSSCAAKYNNRNKTKGTRRSKLEKWLEEQLKIIHPELNIKYNYVTTIKSELDIYIPELELAIELNGPVHYRPMYGEEKFKQIQNHDMLKKLTCIKNDITLAIIDVSEYTPFSTKTASPFLNAICAMIKAKISFLKK